MKVCDCSMDVLWDEYSILCNFQGRWGTASAGILDTCPRCGGGLDGTRPPVGAMTPEEISEFHAEVKAARIASGAQHPDECACIGCEAERFAAKESR